MKVCLCLLIAFLAAVFVQAIGSHRNKAAHPPTHLRTSSHEKPSIELEHVKIWVAQVWLHKLGIFTLIFQKKSNINKRRLDTYLMLICLLKWALCYSLKSQSIDLPHKGAVLAMTKMDRKYFFLKGFRIVDAPCTPVHCPGNNICIIWLGEDFVELGREVLAPFPSWPPCYRGIRHWSDGRRTSSKANGLPWRKFGDHHSSAWSRDSKGVKREKEPELPWQAPQNPLPTR